MTYGACLLGIAASDNEMDKFLLAEATRTKADAGDQRAFLVGSMDFPEGGCSWPSAQSWSSDVRGVGRTGVGGMVWHEGTVCVVFRRDAESARVRALNMLLCDFTATASVCAFSGNDTHAMTLAVPPIRVDTATDAGGGVVHVTVREVAMLRGVELEMLGRGTSGRARPARW